MALPVMGGVCHGLTRDGWCVMALPVMGGVSWPYP